MSIVTQPLLTLFEHDVKAYDWTDADLQALARFSQKTGRDVLRATIRDGKRALQATHYIGVFRFGQVTVQVLPKIYRSHRGTEQEQAREAMQNVLYLLHYTLHLPLHESSLAPLAHQQQDWFEGLIALFSTHLLEAWQHGPYRFYQERQDDLPVLKGKLHIAYHLRHPERKHRFAVTYDEFSVDVPLNRVFRFVVERLWHMTTNAHNRVRLERLRQWMEEVSLLPTMTAEDTRSIIVTRLNQHFAPLLELARLFLDRETLQLSGGSTTTFAFVLDMNQLFEAFLTHFIGRHRHDILPSALQSCALHPQSQGIPQYLATQLPGGKRLFHLKPDLVVYDPTSQRFPLLIDMKYKRLMESGQSIGIAQDDFYQMYAYAHRYDCPCVLLLYPQTADMDAPHYQALCLEDEKKVVVAATIDLRTQLQRKEEQQKLKDALRTLIDRSMTHE